jgi:hypothetical protein
MEPFTVVAITVAATAALGAGMAVASQPNYGETPDYSKLNATTRNAEFDTLPGKRAIEQAARLGTKVKYPTGNRTPLYESDQKYWDTVTNRWIKPVTGYQDEMKTADFTGMGDIDAQEQAASDMAKMILENQQKYGLDYVEEAKRQLELSDPTGTAGRKQLFDMVMKDLESPSPERPVAGALDSQIAEQLKSDSLPTDTTAAIKRSILDSNAADQGLTDEIQAQLETESAAGNRTADQQRMLQWLTSGATPQDVEYRRKQQAMSNVGSFMAGRTPQAQFSQLAGAQQGASATGAAPGLPNFGNDSQNQALNNSMYQQGMRVQATADMINPWMAGLSSLMSATGTGFAAYGMLKGSGSGTAGGSSAASNQFSYQTGG